MFSPSMPSYTPQAMPSYTPQNYWPGNSGATGYDAGFSGPTAQPTYGTPGAGGWNRPGAGGQPPTNGMYKPITPTVGNVALPAGYDNTMAAYNDPDYIKAMAAWSQTALPAYQAINNQQNTDREFGWNQYVQGETLAQTKWRDDQANKLGFGGLDLQKQMAQEASDQFGAEFAYKGQRDVRADWEADRNYNFDVEKTRTEFAQTGEKIQIDRDRQQADAAYQAGTLSINQYVAEMNRLAQVENNALNTRIADQDYERSGQKLQIDSAKQKADALFQQGTLDTNQYKAEMDRLGQIENNARQTAKDKADALYQQGSLQQQRYSTDTGAQISREQMQRAYDTAVMQAVGRNQTQNVRWMRG